MLADPIQISAEMIEAGAETLLEFRGEQQASIICTAIYLAMEAVHQLQLAKVQETVH